MLQENLEEIAEEVRVCTRCPLHRSRTHGVPGEGPIDATIALVGEAPGREEDERGRPFVGRAGRLLDQALIEAGLDRGDLFITNIVKSRPPGNRRPNKGEVEACLPYLWRQLQAIRPDVVGLLGGLATEAILGEKKLSSARGKVFEKGYRFVSTYHPAGVLRNPRFRAVMVEDLRLLKKLAGE
ncbi:MAG: uracil-DNA glycosylase family protein [Candidatus Hydrothermarchaeaceae archaeon]